MTSGEMYAKIYGFVNHVLNTVQNRNITILQSYQNESAPTGLYITIDPVGTLKRIGQGHRTEADPVTGESMLINDYECDIDIIERNGFGDNLQILLDSLNEQTIKDYILEKEFSVFTTGNVIFLPRQTMEKFTRESVVTIKFGFATCYVQKTGYIKEVDYTNNINEY